MRLWYLSHRRPAKAQARLRIRTVSPEPSLFAHIKYGNGRRGPTKTQTTSPLDGRAKSTIISCDGSNVVYGKPDFGVINTR